MSRDELCFFSRHNYHHLSRLHASQMAHNALLRYAAVALLLLVIAWFRPDISGFSYPAASPIDQFHGSKQSASTRDDMETVRKILADNHVGPDITFASRRLKPTKTAKTRLQNTELRDSLFPRRFQNTSIDKKPLVIAQDILHISVTKSPRPNQIDASKLLFGTSTTLERFNDARKSPLKEWARWLTDGRGNSNGAGMILAILGCNEESLQQIRETLANLGIKATVMHSNPDLDMPGRYIDLIRMLWADPSRPQRSYFGLVDDDTFFPAIHQLTQVLSTYNPSKPYYLGTFTERNDWLFKNHFPMAYGGAGIFLTAPTIRQILAADCLAKNPDGKYILDSAEGDRLLYLCLHTHTNIALTPLHQLWQFDMGGDPSGFYESGHQPLSIHHFKTWHHLAPEKSHLVASVCGEDCVSQKFQFVDDFVLSNGYSVVEYPKGIDFDILQVEGTFEFGDGEDVDEETRDVLYVHALGMLRKGLSGTGRKRQWVLMDAFSSVSGKGGSVVQVYVKRKDDQRWIERGVESLPERDSVVVLEWLDY